MANNNNAPTGITLGRYLGSEKITKMIATQIGEKKQQAFISDLLSLSEQNTDLQKCNPDEVIKCAMAATALNLPLSKNLGYAYVIPYNIKDKGMTPQFQIGYKGIVQLAIRSNEYRNINVCDVREGEISFNKFEDRIEFLGENPDNDVVGYLATFELMNGFKKSLYMTVNQIKAHRDRFSKAGKGGRGIWGQDFDGMAKKTVLKLLLNKWGILSVEIQKAQDLDQSDGQGNYIDNPEVKAPIDAEFQDATIDEPVDDTPPPPNGPSF